MAEATFLGVPRREYSLTTAAPTRRDASASKIGGEPWVPAPLVALASPGTPCATCGGKLFFLAQIYAPVCDERLRVLLIFVCNASECAKPQVVVLRLEQDYSETIADETSTKNSKSKKSAQNVSKTDDGKITNSFQDGINVNSAGAAVTAKSSKKLSKKAGKARKKATFTVAWGDEEAPSATLDDLESMLNQRDEAILEQHKQEQKELQKIVQQQETEQDQGQQQLKTDLKEDSRKETSNQGENKGTSRKTLDSISEADSKASVVLDVVDESEWHGMHDAKSVALEHAQELLARYEATEAAEAANVGNDPYANAGGPRAGATVETEEDDEDDDTNSTAALREAFQEYISSAPSQCLRYAYGGEPLIPRKLTTEELAQIPCCEVCGNARVFEAQLLPASLWEWRHSVDAVEIDFSTILIYVCPESCSMTPNSSREYPLFIQAI